MSQGTATSVCPWLVRCAECSSILSRGADGDVRRARKRVEASLDRTGTRQDSVGIGWSTRRVRGSIELVPRTIHDEESHHATKCASWPHYQAAVDSASAWSRADHARRVVSAYSCANISHTTNPDLRRAPCTRCGTGLTARESHRLSRTAGNVVANPSGVSSDRISGRLRTGFAVTEALQRWRDFRRIQRERWPSPSPASRRNVGR
jgi:hypothetical protein